MHWRWLPPESMAMIDSVTTAITWIGLVAFAAEGAFAARSQGLDVVGICGVALAAAVGGGTVRDLLLGIGPVSWMVDPWQPLTIVVIGLVFACQPLTRIARLTGNPMWILCDALGLGMATAVGARAAHQAGLPMPSIALTAIVSGVCGSVLRDVLVNHVPRIFHRSPPYALCAALGAVLYIFFQVTFSSEIMALMSCIMAVVASRVVVEYYSWKFPI